MSTSTLPRQLLKWVLSLDLTYPIRNPKRDFANGFLVAELLSRYFPDDVQMHSFENVTSNERKKSNWHLLKKFFKRYDVPVSKDDVERVMAAADGAVVKVLQAIHDYVHEDPSTQAAAQEDLQYPQYYIPSGAADMTLPEAFQEAPCSPSMSPACLQPGVLPYMQPGMSPYMLQPYALSPTTESSGHQPTSTSDSQTGAAPAGWPLQYPVAPMQQPSYSQQAYAQAPAQYAQQSYFAQQPASQVGAGMQHMQSASTSVPPQHMATPAVQFAEQQQAYELGHSPEVSMPSIEYDKRPRAVDYKPYTQQDYSSRNFDAKRQDYWKLGTLGPQIEDEDLQAKRRKAEELKELARSIRDKNARLASMSTNPVRRKVETPKSKSVREKALEFARNVPRPEMKRPQSSGSSSGESTPKQQQQASGLTEIQKLQAQHAAHRQKVESIRQEFVRMASS